MIFYKNTRGLEITEEDAIINGNYSKYFITNDNYTKIEIYSENKLLKVIFELEDREIENFHNFYKDVKITFNLLKWERVGFFFMESQTYFNRKLESISHLLKDSKKQLIACQNLDISSLRVLSIEKYAYSKDSSLKYVFEYCNDGTLCIINDLEEGSNLYKNFDNFDWSNLEYYKNGQFLPRELLMIK